MGTAAGESPGPGELSPEAVPILPLVIPMMRRHAVVAVILCLPVLLPNLVVADSPITSTPFSEAYMDYPAVRVAAASGVMTPQLAEYLGSSAPLDVKAAVINALSWQFGGKENADLYCKMRYRTTLEALDVKARPGPEQMVLGYLMVMDDYFKPERALPVLEMARKNLPESFTVAMLLALVQSQGTWGTGDLNPWRRVERVLDDADLNGDMRLGAVRIITEYMSLYAED